MFRASGQLTNECADRTAVGIVGVLLRDAHERRCVHIEDEPNPRTRGRALTGSIQDGDATPERIEVVGEHRQGVFALRDRRAIRALADG